jgi:hypothetical protein
MMLIELGLTREECSALEVRPRARRLSSTSVHPARPLMRTVCGQVDVYMDEMHRNEAGHVALDSLVHWWMMRAVQTARARSSPRPAPRPAPRRLSAGRRWGRSDRKHAEEAPLLSPENAASHVLEPEAPPPPPPRTSGPGDAPQRHVSIELSEAVVRALFRRIAAAALRDELGEHDADRELACVGEDDRAAFDPSFDDVRLSAVQAVRAPAARSAPPRPAAPPLPLHGSAAARARRGAQRAQRSDAGGAHAAAPPGAGRSVRLAPRGAAAARRRRGRGVAPAPDASARVRARGG